MGDKQTHIHQSPLNTPDRATTISSLIKNRMNDRASPGCGRQGNARGCDITPTSRILIIIVGSRERCRNNKKRTLFETNVLVDV